MRYLLDTHVLSELRMGKRADAGVQHWFADIADDALYTSVLVLGEVRRGIDSIRRRDPAAAEALAQWLARLLATFADRVVAVDSEVADRWGRQNLPAPLPTVDGLMAATALVHDMVLVTRNVRDVASSGALVCNPFAGGRS